MVRLMCQANLDRCDRALQEVIEFKKAQLELGKYVLYKYYSDIEGYLSGYVQEVPLFIGKANDYELTLYSQFNKYLATLGYNVQATWATISFDRTYDYKPYCQNNIVGSNYYKNINYVVKELKGLVHRIKCKERF